MDLFVVAVLTADCKDGLGARVPGTSDLYVTLVNAVPRSNRGIKKEISASTNAIPTTISRLRPSSVD